MEIAAGKADEAAGLAPGNEDNAAGGDFNPEKPCLPLSPDVIIVSAEGRKRKWEIHPFKKWRAWKL